MDLDAIVDADVIIVGAGLAGLAALRSLRLAGINAICLEARDRIGGRILTIHDPLSPLPIELGAEFIHGRPPEIWDIVREAALPVYQGVESSVFLKEGEVEDRADSWNIVDQILEDMASAAANPQDMSFEEFLAATSYSDTAKQSARGYVEGFNAADSHRISIQALSEETKAASLIDGDRVFRFVNGYHSVPLFILRSTPGFSTSLMLNHVVLSVEWQRSNVSVKVRHDLTGTLKTLHARRLIVTVPLGVLQADPGAEGAIAFQPQPEGILRAAHSLCFGQVVRAVIRFRTPFWESNPDLANAGFMLSQQPVFPTWWTTLSVRSSNLVAWSAGVKADPLLNQPRAMVQSQALSALASLTGFPPETVLENVQNIHFHGWHSDPYARGAYSYVPTGALSARKALAEPVENTLYFAGEATDQQGHSATAHGAIATGVRAAQQLLSSWP